MFTRKFASATIVLAAALSIGVGCDMMKKKDSKNRTEKTAGKTLYARLGGEPAITAVIHDFVGRAAADPKVNFTRKGHQNQWDPTPENVAMLEKRLVQFVAHAA